VNTPSLVAVWMAMEESEDRLSEDDDHQQTVALGDVLRVPRRRTRALRPHRNEQLCRTQNGERQQPKLERKPYGGDSPHDLTRGHA
jgi:hypothetical protein